MEKKKNEAGRGKSEVIDENYMSRLGRTGGFDCRGLGFSLALYLHPKKERTNHISKVITDSDICIYTSLVHT